MKRWDYHRRIGARAGRDLRSHLTATVIVGVVFAVLVAVFQSVLGPNDVDWTTLIAVGGALLVYAFVAGMYFMWRVPADLDAERLVEIGKLKQEREDHYRQEHPPVDLRFSASSTPVGDSSCLSFIEVRGSPGGQLHARGISIGGEVQRPWEMSWGTDGQKSGDTDGGLPAVLNVAQFDWRPRQDEMTVWPIKPGVRPRQPGRDASVYAMHNAHGLHGLATTIAIELGGSRLGGKRYALSLAAWWDHEGGGPRFRVEGGVLGSDPDDKC